MSAWSIGDSSTPIERSGRWSTGAATMLPTWKHPWRKIMIRFASKGWIAIARVLAGRLLVQNL